MLLVGGLVLLVFQDHVFMLIQKYSSPEIRIYTWRNVCVALIKDHPLVGAGLATYSKIAPSYAPDAIKSSAHNLYLHYLGEIGFLGTFFLMLSIGTVVTYMVRLFRRVDPSTSNVLLGFILSIAGLLLFGMIETVLNGFQLGLLFWSLMGIGLGIYSREKKIIILRSEKNDTEGTGI